MIPEKHSGGFMLGLRQEFRVPAKGSVSQLYIELAGCYSVLLIDIFLAAAKATANPDSFPLPTAELSWKTLSTGTLRHRDLNACCPTTQSTELIER